MKKLKKILQEIDYQSKLSRAHNPDWYQLMTPDFKPFDEDDDLEEKIKGADGKACWKGYRYAGTEDGKDKCVKVKENDSPDGKYCIPADKKAGKSAVWTQGAKSKCVKVNERLGIALYEHDEPVVFQEAEYQGRKVKLNKPTRGDVKKFKVYVKDPKTGNVKKVNFGHGGKSATKAGEKTMRIKKSNPARRKSFRARHNCDNPGPKTKARYWSCRAW